MSFSFKEIFKPGKFVVSDHTVAIVPKVEVPVVDNPTLVAAAAASTRQVGPTRIANVNMGDVSAMLTSRNPDPLKFTEPGVIVERGILGGEIIDPPHLLDVAKPTTEEVVPAERVERGVAKSVVGKASVEQIEKVFSESPARVFFDMILEDAANLVKTGKDLEALVSEKARLSEAEETEGQIIRDVQIANEKLTQEISRLLNNASKKDLDREFKTASESFMEAFDRLQILADKMEATGRISGNKLSLQIQARKQEINKIFTVVGGPKNFDVIKKWVKNVEAKQLNYSEQWAANNFGKDFAIRSSQAIYTFLNSNREDLPVVTKLAASGAKASIIDIITMMAMDPKSDLFKM